MTQRYGDLEAAIDGTHALFDRWIAETSHPLPTPNTLHYARLALHEWIANLIQHADFKERDPEITIRVQTNERHVHCRVTDNSSGFEMEDQLRAQIENGHPFPERTMGLRIIDACTEDLSYDCTAAGKYQISFTISKNHLPCLNNLF